MELPNRYASVWPCSKITIRPQKGALNSFNQDMINEGHNGQQRHPDHVFTITGLDIAAMNTKLDEFIKNGTQYHIIGSNRLFNGGRANSCSGLVYDLLIAGGIDKLTNEKNFIRDNVITTPNSLVDLLRNVE